MKEPRFRKLSEQVEGVYLKFQMSKCASCGWEDQIRDSAPSGLPEEPVKKKFQQRGWEMGQRRSDDICPKCVAKRSAPKPKEKPAVAVEAPRQPTIDDKRRIREALFGHYIEEKGCYAKAHSDRSVAASLNVPFAWVTNTREALGFGPDANEASSAFTGEILSIRADLKTLQDAMLEFLGAKCDALEKRLAAVERAGARSAA